VFIKQELGGGRRSLLLAASRFRVKNAGTGENLKGGWSIRRMGEQRWSALVEGTGLQ